MRFFPRKGSAVAKWPVLLCLIIGLLISLELQAKPTLKLDHVLVQTSLYTDHFSSSDEHTNNQHLASIELHDPNRWLMGAAWFKNSFNQPTWYFYAGREFPFWQPTNDFEVRGKLTGGLLRGYKGEYRDKIPFNRHGIAPAVLPSIGARWGRVESDLIVFGTAGLMITGGVRF
ncbi:hypothetical protein GCM10007160_28420 [Litchfieldella qijiaojingensis]|uniref:Sn-glycerol-3-phosphate transporter n=1 Tax=Litchfieldella qijiaojingensis TaxID=980347 RepID=A0ABQ2Z0A3_9GAMM|nr:hypothetical protein [Halomonas qijiaojingensis]GGX99131.1 hypothetical protein GCM10007160_28420 [Halomonas qijiaojingensis]